MSDLKFRPLPPAPLHSRTYKSVEGFAVSYKYAMYRTRYHGSLLFC